MNLFAISIVYFVSVTLDILLFLMFARAIISWLPQVAESRLGEFLYTVTEWLIMPVRTLFDAFNFNPSIPLDIPFFVTFMILSIVSSIL